MRQPLGLVAGAVLAVALGWPARAPAYDFYYDQSCAQCHGPTRTCSGCHAHGVHALANKLDFDVTATTNKTSYAAGEDVIVSVKGGYRCGWVRMLLLDDQMTQLARSSGPGGLGNGADSCTTGGVQLRAPAPAQAGTYTWYAAWYGNTYDLFERNGTPTTFGPRFRDGPGANHGRELVPVTIQVVAGGAPAVALSPSSLAFPRIKVGATSTLSTQIQNGGSTVLKIQGIARCDPAAAPFSWTAPTPISIAPGAAATLSITYHPTSAVSDASCVLIATNDPAKPSVRVDLTGAADPPPSGTPAVGTSVASLDFGVGVLAGTYVARTFEVKSTGSANVDVTSLDACAGSTGMYRWSSPLPGTIAPAEARTVTVYYTPTGAGPHAGCVTINSSGGSVSVTFTGSAVMPAVTCTSCHGGKDNATGAPPTDAAGETATTRVTVGAHTAHLNTQISPTTAQQARDCSSCHQTVQLFTDPLHNDGSVDVPFGGVAKAGGANPSWNAQTPTCGAVYCHGATMAGGTNTAPSWTSVGAGEAACGKCHGVPPDPTTGHPAVAADLAGCASCHPDTMTAGGTIDPAGKHINGIVEATGCTSCHGSSANPAPPKGTKGETATTSVAVGAHQQHVKANAIAARIACTECHGAASASYTSGHANGAVDISFGPLANEGTSTSWDRASATCATSYCHGGSSAVQGGSAITPVWTRVDGTQATCGSCHGFPPPAPHAQSTACSSCHPGTVNSDGTINVAGGLHLNGSIDVASLSCTSCHGSPGVNAAPPADTKGNLLTTALGVGAHQKHVADSAVARAIACGECHGGAADTYTVAHSDGTVQVSFGTLANQGTTTAWDRTAATCSASYCHAQKGGSATAPVWTTVDGTQAACDSCHGAPPPSSAGHPASGSAPAACAACHPSTVKADGTIDVAGGKHVDGALQVDYAAMTCTSCHGTAGRTGSDPFIAAAPPTGTQGETANTTRAVGAHMAHLQAGAIANAFACTDCHNPPTSNDHANGTVEMSFSALAKGTGTPVWNGSTCASTYCHGNFKNGNAANAPSWTGGASQVGCASCHGSPPGGTHPANAACEQCHLGYTATSVNRASHVNGLVDTNLTCTSCHGTAGVNAAPPADTKGGTATTLVSVGAHQAHAAPALRGPIDCAECHGAAVSSYTNTHSNSTVDVSFGTLSNTGTTTVWSHTAATCASNYCHGGSTALKGGSATTPLWTKVDGTQKTCASCHGNPPPSSSGHVQRTDCGSCHTGYTSSSVNVATHINGVVDATAMTCTSCHGDATRVAVANADPNVKAAPPIDTKGNTASTAPGVGVHQVHVNGTRSRPVLCSECHAGSVPGTPIHADGTTTVAFGTLSKTGAVTPAYTGGSCSATYCHGNFNGGSGGGSTPPWTTAGALACTACHGNPPALPHPQDASCADCHGTGYSQATVNAATHVDGAVTLVPARTGCTQCHGDGTRTAIAGADANTPAAPPIGSKGETATAARAVGAHQAHLNQKTFRASTITCAECHPVPAAGDKAHANGTVAMTFGTLSRTGGLAATWNSTALSCAVYCHGATGGTVIVQGGTNTAPIWTGTFAAGTSSLTCASCHGAPPTANGHPQRTDCGTCHTGATSTAYNSANHINGVIDVVSLSCTSCHGNASLAAVPGADTNVKAAPPVDTKNNSATTAVGVGVHQVHVNGSRSKPVACAECHSGAVPTSPQHENGVVTVAFGTLARTGGITSAAYTAGGGSCSATYCHGNFTGGAGTAATPAWTAAGALGCTSCHGDPPALPHPQDTSCADCHGSGYSQTTVMASTHIDGAVAVVSTRTGCTQCHGDGARTPIAGADANTVAAPPIGSKGETATTARAVGAHQAHLNQKTFRANPIACTECHTVPPAGDQTHANGTAAVTFGALAKTGNVTPAWNTTALTCATVYCHGGTTAVRGGTNTTPAWTGTFTAGTSSLTCTSCHGDPPTSPHPQNNACSSCHTGYGDKPATGAQIVNATLHLNGVLDVQNMTCTSCHGDASRVAVFGADANFQAAPPVDTKGNSVTTAQGVGVHQVHVNGSRSRPVACSDCHAGAVPTSTSHADGVVTVAFSGVATTGIVSPAYAGAGGSCSATYCHGNFTGGAGAAGTPNWVAAGTLGCTSCHGNPPALPHPQDTSCADCHGPGYSLTTVNAATHVDGVVTLPTTAHVAGSCTACHGDNTKTVIASADANAKGAPPIGSKGETATTARAVGAHAAHLNQTTFRSLPLACTECHTVPAAGDKTHANGTAAVTFGALAKTGSLTPAYNTTAFTCASTYCHGGTAAVQGGTNTTPTWTGAFTAGASSLTCTSCHGAPPTANGHPQRTDCGTCHTGATSTAYNSANHINGAVDVISTLSCTTCHGNASLVAVTGADTNVKAAPPVDTKNNSATTAIGVGVHQVHVNGSRSKPVACAECHSGAVPTSLQHENGVVTVAFGTLAKTGGITSAAYTAGGGSCSATYCHGNFTGGAGTAATPAWTAAGTLGCTSCHGNPPALPHPQDTSCADCHGTGYSTTAVVASTHIDGAVTLVAAHSATAAGGCAQCHGNATVTVTAGADANTPAAPPIGSKGETATTARAVGAHAAHVNQKTFRANPIACNECHTVPPTGDKTHATGNATVVFGALASTAGATPAWSTTALTCAATYCHGGSSATLGGTNTTPAWTGTYTAGSSTLTCTSCHGDPPPTPHVQRTDCGSCHTGATSTAYGAATHLNGVVDAAAMTCTSCHGSATLVAVAGADANVKAAPPVDTKGNSATTARGVGVHQVHVNGSRSKPVTCSECHSGAVPTSTTHADGTTTVAFGALAKTGGITTAAYSATALTCASTYCHGNFSGGAGTAATPTWVTAGTLGCTSCHGNPPALPHPQSTACADCHGTGYSSTAVVASTHIDGAVTLVAAHSATAAGGCAQCHGNATVTVVAGADTNTPAAPPIGSKGETATTARAVGAHAAHVNQKTFRANPIACTECHTVPAAGDKTHANGTAAVAFGTLARTGGITTAAWNTTTLTCASTYCHGNFNNGANGTPAWTGTFTAGASTLGCTGCHGDPPGGTHPISTACSQCHTGYGDKPATGAQTINATSHLNGTIDVANLTCTSCHGNAALVAVTGADANVKAAPPVDTKGNSATTARGVGVHQVHVNGSRSKPVACSECHSGAVPTSTTHSDGTTTVAFGTLAKTGGITTAAYSATALTCASTYCHGNFSGGAGTAATPAWTAAGTLGCTSCHGNPPALPHPQDTSCADCHGTGYSSTAVVASTHIDGAVTLVAAHSAAAAGGCAQCHGNATVTVVAGADTNTPAAPPIGSKGETATTARAVGAHAAHVNQKTFRANPIACTECHAVPAAGDKTHANGTAAVAFGALARTGSLTPVWNTTAFTCASTYCHGGAAAVQGGTNTTPTWTGTFTSGTSSLACTSCHGAPPTANGHPQRTDCASCHTGATSTAYNSANHINGAVDVISTLSCTTCHGNASLVAVPGADTNVKAAPPVDTKNNSATTAVGVGVHQVHVNGSRSKPVACAECHSGAVPTSPQHENGVVTVAFGTLAKTGGITTTAYTAGGGSCSATYCHGNFSGGAGTAATPTWVTAGTLGCTSCHGNPPALPHPQSTACADCHGTGYSTTAVVATSHVDGAVTLVAAHAAGTCSACHGDASLTALAGADANVKAAPPIGTRSEAATTTRAVGAHQRHVNAATYRNPITCNECHAVPAAGDKTHANGAVNITFGTLARTGSVTPAYNTTAMTCGSTYCHGNFTGGKKTYSPTWTTPATTVCGTCHGLPPSSTEDPSHPTVASGGSCSGCHAGYNATTAGGSVNLATHMNGLVDASGGESAGGAACGGCHTQTWSNMTSTATASKHSLVGAADTATDTGGAWSTATTLSAIAPAQRSCVNMCHGDHPHNTTSPAGTTHEYNLYVDASSTTTRANGSATRTTTNRAKVDFDPATNKGMCTSCHNKAVDTARPAVADARSGPPRTTSRARPRLQRRGSTRCTTAPRSSATARSATRAAPRARRRA